MENTLQNVDDETLMQAIQAKRSAAAHHDAADQAVFDGISAVLDKPRGPLGEVDDATLLQAIQAKRAAVTEPSLIDTGMDLARQGAEAIGDAWTGEGRIEYPDLPEITDIEDIGIFESLWPNLKAGLTMNPAEKARIFAESFKGDSRFGGVTQDKFGNPILKWTGKQFYINKSGISGTDTRDLAAQGIQIFPAAKVASGAKTAIGRFMAGVPLYGGTNILQQYGTMAGSGKEAVDLGQAGEMGVMGGGVEAVLPPVLKGAAKVGRLAWDATKKAWVAAGGTATARKAAQPAGKIPLTEGQRSGDMGTLRREEGLRQGGYGDAASGTMRNFDEGQMRAVRSEAEAVQGELGAGSGFEAGRLTDIGESLQGSLVTARDAAKQGVKKAYQAARKENPSVSVFYTDRMVNQLRATVDEFGIDLRDAPVLKNALDRLDDFTVKIPPGTTDKLATFGIAGERRTLEQLERYRRSLNQSMGAATPPEKAALMRMKNALDAWEEEAVTWGLFGGDTEALALLKTARGSRTRYGKLYEAGRTASGKKDPAGVAMVKILDVDQATPEQTINFLVGIGKVKSNATTVGLVKRIKSVFGDQSEQVGLMKDAFILKVLSSVQRGERTITRGGLVKDARLFLNEDGKTLSKELFKPSELQRIDALVRDVARTITPADALNPSRSAWALMRVMQDHNLLSMAGKAMKYVPLGSEVGRTMEAAGGSVTARNATSQLERLMSAPLVSAGAAGAALQAHEAARPPKRATRPQAGRWASPWNAKASSPRPFGGAGPVRSESTGERNKRALIEGLDPNAGQRTPAEGWERVDRLAEAYKAKTHTGKTPFPRDDVARMLKR